MVLSVWDIEGTAHVSRGDWSSGIYFEVMSLEEKDGERESSVIVEGLIEGGEDAEIWRKSETARKGKGSILSDLSFMISGTSSQCCILFFIFIELPPPSSALLPPLLFSVAIYCPKEKTKEQQEDSVWCIVGSSVMHTEINVKSVVGSSECVL